VSHDASLHVLPVSLAWNHSSVAHQGEVFLNIMHSVYYQTCKAKKRYIASSSISHIYTLLDILLFSNKHICVDFASIEAQDDHVGF